MMIVYRLNNSVIKISLEERRVVSFIFKGDELIKGNIPFFAIKTRDKNGKTSFLDAFNFEYIKSDNKHYFSNQLFDVALSINKKSENELTWGIDIKNKSTLLIEQVEIMSIGLLDKLVEEVGGKGQIVIPYNEGALVSNLSRRLKSPFGYYEADYPSLGKYFVFPNMLCSQFVAYLVNGGGIYFGMHDPSRTTKHLDFNLCGNALKIQMRTFTNTNYGEDYHMPYNCVMHIFDGDYYDAFEIYRKWFDDNLPNYLIPIKDNKEIPNWYHDSPLVVTYPIRGNSDSDTKMIPNSKFYPYLNQIDILKDIENKTDSRVMALLMQWESHAPWCPPFYWPPYGGEEMFDEFVDACHNNGFLIGLYASGLSYTLESLLSSYSNKDDFDKQNIKSIVCTNTNQEAKSTIVSNIRHGYDLCPSMEETKLIIADEINKALSHKLDYIQVLDQNHGGCSYFCYSDNHGHIPAPGCWQQVETNKLLDMINNHNSLLGCESAAAEPFISKLLFSDNRFILNYYIGEPIPLYSYIYHEYVNNFMGNQICMSLENNPHSYTYRLAYSFLCGDMLTIILNSEADLLDAWCLTQTVNKEVVLGFIKRLNRWRRDMTQYLHYGKMEKPEKITTSLQEFINEDKSVLKVNSVLTSAFSDGKKTIQFLVNFNLEAKRITFQEEKEIYLDSKLKNHIKTKEINIPPLGVLAFDLK